MDQRRVGVPCHKVGEVVVLQGDGFDATPRLTHVGDGSGDGRGGKMTGGIGHPNRTFNGNQRPFHREAFVEDRDGKAGGTGELSTGLC